jgi:glycosyltransferase A (GT-A) superfamily protein (DUF2064 family)
MARAPEVGKVKTRLSAAIGTGLTCAYLLATALLLSGARHLGGRSRSCGTTAALGTITMGWLSAVVCALY